MNAELLPQKRELELNGVPLLSETQRLKQWIYDRIISFTSGNIVEVSSGNGDISDIFIRNHIPITLSDSRDYCRNELSRKFHNEPILKSIQHINLLDEYFELTHIKLLEQFNTIFALNVSEYASLSRLEISNAGKMLAPLGYIVFWLPVYTALYNKLDQGFRRWHKYNIQYIQSLIPANFEIVKMRYFNLVGIVENLLSSYTFKKTAIELKEQTLFQDAVPCFQIEDIMYNQKGLSVIVTIQKNEGSQRF